MSGSGWFSVFIMRLKMKVIQDKNGLYIKNNKQQQRLRSKRMRLLIQRGQEIGIARVFKCRLSYVFHVLKY